MLCSSAFLINGNPKGLFSKMKLDPQGLQDGTVYSITKETLGS
jgi:hypothetical protein